MIHLVVLGAASHAILVWSRYSPTRCCVAHLRRQQTNRLALFNTGQLLSTRAARRPRFWRYRADSSPVLCGMGRPTKRHSEPRGPRTRRQTRSNRPSVWRPRSSGHARGTSIQG
jgi:hypothetical protein